MISPVRRILDTWVANLNRGSLDDVVDMYALDAVLLATFETEPARTPAAIGAYFAGLGARVDLSVEVEEDSLSEHGTVIAGLYTFAHGSGPERVTAPSRFTLVVDPGQERPILHHHSSLLP